MSSLYSEQHEAFRQKVRTFFREEVDPNVKAWEKKGIFDPALFRKAGAAGLLGASIPSEYGGGGGDFLNTVILFEEHGYSEGGASIEQGLTVDAASVLILANGTEEQKRYWLPRYVTGEVISEGGFSERQSGSDMINMTATAELRDGKYVINGEKVWIGNGSLMTTIIVAAMTDPSAGAKGMSLFIVDTDAPGVKVTARETMTKGAGNYADFSFKNVVVGEDRLVGGVTGRGVAQALSGVNIVRLASSARMLAACELALEKTAAFTKHRKMFGKTLFDFQNTQFILADIKTEIAVSRAFLNANLEKLVDGTVSAVDTAMVKLWMSDLENRVFDKCLPLFGAYGYSNDCVISKLRNTAYGRKFALGTPEIQRIAIARSI